MAVLENTGATFTGQEMKKHKDKDLMAKAYDALKIIGPKVGPETVQILEPLILALEFRLEEMDEEELFYSLPKEVRDKMRLSATGNRNRWNFELDAKFELAKKYRAEGKTIVQCCELSGINEETWYRRSRIEKYGNDRQK